MLTKLYEQIKSILVENYKFFLSFILAFLILTYQLPYYINTPGGLIDITKKIELESDVTITGSLNLTYVSELKGTIPSLIIAYFNSDWDILKREEIVADNETLAEMSFRDHLLLEEANQNAIIYAYRKADKLVQLQNEKMYVTYVDPNSKTDLKIEDQIMKVDQEPVTNKTELYQYLGQKRIGEKVEFTILREEKELIREAEIVDFDGSPKVGIIITEKRDVVTDPTVTLHFSKSESGPSGGFMMSLAIYQYLTEDLTHGKTIAGTGTIDLEGNVGTIGGIEYKLKGAVKEKADVFFAPSGENYEDAVRLKEEKNYQIEVVEIKTFEDAIRYLSHLA